jgi:hypothetical protein
MESFGGYETWRKKEEIMDSDTVTLGGRDTHVGAGELEDEEFEDAVQFGGTANHGDAPPCDEGSSASAGIVAVDGGAGQRLKKPGLEKPERPKGRGAQETGEPKESRRPRDKETDENTRCETLARCFRKQRREHGIAQADAAWVEQPFAVWMRRLDGDGSCPSTQDLEALAVGMAEALAIRDALIVSLVAGRGQCDKRRMVAFASRPHDPRNARSMYRLLRSAFEDEHAALDRRRCHAGVAMMRDMADAVAGRFKVQPLAVAGYILWWMGEGKALEYALRALGLDQGCTLAAIVCSALEQGVGPANSGKRQIRGRSSSE